ncbi:uncharacterized protein N7500_007800 [Penicillium coprophilum]|uniref:uncharacterized protein n=1 Tax=Penicillium coprophilum TaxID=36646 RepID=UPI00238C0211|nr:uncharacterized protein N7500_007800 [Penicillium coprophilum]KAJ5158149.1 hypothetical protein N7500_007800 [Penicillium coprophilum]
MIGWDQETYCLTMGYLEKGNLEQYVQQNTQHLTPRLQLQWSRQAAKALGVLHGQHFPDVSSILCGTVIMQCRYRRLKSAHTAYDALAAVERRHLKIVPL